MGVLSAVLIEAGETIASETLLATLTPGEVSVSTVTDASAAVADATHDADVNSAGAIPMGPAVRALLDEHGLSPDAISATGKGGRLLKEDVLGYLKGNESARQPDNVTEPAERQRATDAPISADVPTSERVEKRVPMTRMRARIAERLLGATQQTAMLTTFNEVNMAPLMKLRKQYRDEFESVHNGTRLGFMGFFVKAACEALKRFPEVNASIDGNDVVYHGYQDIGVAVSVDEGLVVPVLRDADFMSIADVEAAIAEFGAKAKDKKLTIEDMTGGTFTVSNGGVWIVGTAHSQPSPDGHPWHALDSRSPDRHER